MSTMKMLFRTTAVVVGSSAALLIGGIAHADTGQPANPAVSASDVVGQLATSAANAPQMLQNLATALGATPPAPPAPPPLAGAAIRVPQPMPVPGLPGASPAAPVATAALPGITSAVPATTPAVPGMPALPGLTSVVPGSTAVAPAAGPAQLVPSAQIDLPQVPFLPVPLPQQLSFPGDLASLAHGGVPIPQPITQPAFSPAAAGPVTSPNPLLLPLSALP